jgi:hypothetical protein
MPWFLIFEDVRETRKYIVEAEDYEGAVAAWEEAQEVGDIGSFVEATTLAYEVQRVDETGNVVEIFPAVEVE